MKQITFKQMDYDGDARIFQTVTITTIEAIQIHPALLIVGAKAFVYIGPIQIDTL